MKEKNNHIYLEEPVLQAGKTEMNYKNQRVRYSQEIHDLLASIGGGGGSSVQNVLNNTVLTNATRSGMQ